MTAPETIPIEERVARLERLVEQLVSQLAQNETIIATAVFDKLKEEVVLTELIHRVTGAVESEWTGKFLPELRRSVSQDVTTAIEAMTKDVAKIVDRFETSLNALRASPSN